MKIPKDLLSIKKHKDFLDWLTSKDISYDEKIITLLAWILCIKRKKNIKGI